MFLWALQTGKHSSETTAAASDGVLIIKKVSLKADTIAQRLIKAKNERGITSLLHRLKDKRSPFLALAQTLKPNLSAHKNQELLLPGG